MSAPGHRASLAAILSACIAYGIGMGMTLPLLGLVLERMGVTGSMNGLNLATAGLAAFVVTPFMPRWIRVIGAANLLALSLVCSAVCLIALYEVPSLWLWFPVRFVFSAALNGLFVATEFWINSLADETNRGRYVALYSICLVGSLGIGPMVLQVIGTHGLAPFAAGAAMLIVSMVPLLLARNTAPQIEEGEHGSVFSLLRYAPAAFAAAAVFGAIDAGMGGLLPVYAVRLGYSEAHAALALTAMAGGSILFQYPIGWLADHMERRRLLALCAFAGVLGAVALPFAMPTPALFYLVIFLSGGMVLGIYSVGLTLLGERFKGPKLATANAGFALAYCFGMLVGPATEGWALEAWNPQGLVVVFGLICLGYMIFLLLPGAAKTAS